MNKIFNKILPSLIGAIVAAAGAHAGTELPQYAPPVINGLTQSFKLASGTVVFVPVDLPASEKIAGVIFYQANQGNYASDTSNVVALYRYSAGTLTRVAVSTDDGNLWKQISNTWGSKSFNSWYDAAPGLYYIGIIYHCSAQTQAPTIGASASVINSSVQTIDFTSSGKLYGELTGQTTCPSSVPMSAITGMTSQPWVGLALKP